MTQIYKANLTRVNQWVFSLGIIVLTLDNSSHLQIKETAAVNFFFPQQNLLGGGVEPMGGK